MKKIKDYQIDDLGADHSQYFQGPYHRGWPFTVVGQGENPKEALADALDTVSGMGYATEHIPNDLSEETEIPLIEEGDGDEENPAGSPHPEWWHRVAFRWNQEEEASDEA